MSCSLKIWVFSSGGWTKKKYRYLVTSGCLLFRKVWWAVWIGSFWPKIEIFYRPEWTTWGTIWKWISSIFKFRNEYCKQLDRKRQKKKNEVICLVSMFPSWAMVLKLSKKVHFLQFCADLSKKSKSIKAIYIYASERSRYALSENGIFIMIWLTVSKILVFEVEKFS